MSLGDSALVVDLESLNLDASRLAELVERARSGVEDGPLPSVQIAIAKNGQLALFETYGEADNSSRYITFSCIKPLVASAIWLLMGEGKLDVKQRVGHYIEEFSDNGKEVITVEQLLCHTAGFPHAPMGPPDWSSRKSRLRKMQTWRLNWEPGSQMEYHATSAHWVLAELIERVTESDYRSYIGASIAQPLGLKSLQLGALPEQQSNITTLRSVGEPPSAQEMELLFGVAITLPEMADASLLRFNETETRALGVPGAGGIANAADIAMFYQQLLHNTSGLWDAAILADAIGRVRANAKDPQTGVAANRGLGVVIAGDDGHSARRGMSKYGSAKCFGHQGVGGQVAWADPVSGLSFCLLTNGLDANPIRSARFAAALNNSAARC